ncbi:type IV conjugative transfer system coupling protein TraD [Erwinia aphidicola]|uniref:type IV conjugative transfer system coupling protein TraD n=1 Tax=Erwinia aphidicola TaxID=68334 RepID=UPI00300D86F2
MSFTPKNLTQGGQMTAYRLRMFAQVNQWIFNWILLLFVLMTGLIFWGITPDDTLRNGFWHWTGQMFSSLVPLMNPSSPATWDILYHCGDGKQLCKAKLTLAQVIADPWMREMGANLWVNLKLCATVSAVFCSVLFCLIAWYVGRIGRKEGEDEYISGMTLTEDVPAVNRMLKKLKQRSDLQIGGLHMVQHAEVMNFLIHGTIGVGKSTLIRWLLDYIRKRGDRAIIWDSGGTFTETHYDERRDVVMNPHDERCPNWVLWRECTSTVDYDNLTEGLMPEEGESDPFWVSSARTITADTAMRMASDPDRSIEKFLTTLMSMGLKDLREYLKNLPSANLVEEKIEKTAISIRSVVTNYAKSLRYLQGLDRDGRPEFSIREWMTDAKYDSSWMFISTSARHRTAVRPLISMWLSLATLYLQSMGENPDRRVWFILDELPALQKIPGLAGTLAEARKFGGCFVIGIQNIPQLITIYGQQMAKTIFDLLNTRAYGRNPSAEVAKIVEEDLGPQRRREAREQNSYGLDQVRDGVSISKDKVRESVVDYEQVMRLPNLSFYMRLPGEFPVVKLKLKYRQQRKYHPALMERNIRDTLSPELEQMISQNERSARAAGIAFPTGSELLEQPDRAAVSTPSASRRAERPALHTAPVTTAARLKTEEPEMSTKEVPPSPAASGEPDAATPAPAKATVLTLVPRTKTASRAAPVEQKPRAEDTAPKPVTADVSAKPVTVAKTPSGSPLRVMPAVKAPAGTGEATASPAPLSALDYLNLRRQRKADDDTQDADEAAAQSGGGEAPELVMEAEIDVDGTLNLRTAGVEKSVQPGEKTDGKPDASRANRSMADDEKNILHHHPADDWEAYSAMQHNQHESGDFER